MKHTTNIDGALGIAWQTPVGLMEGLLTPQGWSALEFPPEPQQSITEGAPVEMIWASWPSARRRYWTPRSSMLNDIDELTIYLADYFAGREPKTHPRLAPCSPTPFESAVWREACSVSFGETITYGELARRVGRPGGARAVGQIMGRNPLVLLQPCHRVLAAGKLGGFSSGLPLKQFLLACEGHGLMLMNAICRDGN